MWIDLIYIILIAIAIFNGYKNGFVGALLSAIGVIIGIAAAIKMSVVVVRYLGSNTEINSSWLPFIAFLIVFALVMIAVKILSKVIETAMSALMIGWLNKTMGMLLYAFMYTAFFSVAIFYFISVSKINVQELSNESLILPMILDFGPWVLNLLSEILPFLKNSYQELQEFFGNWSVRLNTEMDSTGFE